jgi:toxin YoeB
MCAERLLTALARACGENLPPQSIEELRLVEAILRDPFAGIGKPEPLKRLESGVWSRRPTEEHRIVYPVKEDRVEFL